MGSNAMLEQTTAGLAVAYAEGGDSVLAAQVAGYAQAKLGAQRIRSPMRNWLDERLDAALADLAPADRARATERGRRLDRRGFMGLVSRAEDIVGGGERG
jgi:hypothetical protein